MIPLKKRFIEGMVEGIAAWFAYGLVECTFSVVLPYFTGPSYSYVPSHWTALPLLVALYIALGGMLGGLTAVCISLARRLLGKAKEAASGEVKIVAQITVILVLITDHLQRSGFRKTSTWAAIVLAAVFVSVLVHEALQPSSKRSLRSFLAPKPWIQYALILAVNWINGEFASRSNAVKIACFLLLCAAIIGVSLVLQWITEWMARRSQYLQGWLGRWPMLVSGFVILMLIAGFFLRQTIILKEEPPRSSPPQLPTIILITMDTVRANHMSVYGYRRPTTPNLQALAKHGILYTHAISTSDMTLASHVSLFTGLYAGQHGSHPDLPQTPIGRRIDDHVRTLPEVLQKAGYYTAAVIANVGYLTHTFGFDRGFNYYDQRYNRRVLERRGAAVYLKNRLTDFLLLPRQLENKFELGFRRGDEINAAVDELLDRIKGEKKPLFLFVNYMDAHRPYAPAGPYDRLYLESEEQPLTQVQYDAMKDAVISRKRGITKAERDHLIARYDAGITFVDSCIAALLDRLKDTGFMKDAVVIVTADHGESFGEKSIVEHGWSVYGEQVHVPLLISGTPIQGKLVATPVSLVDIMPTIMGVLGQKSAANPAAQGRNIIAPDFSQTDVYCESYPMPRARKYPQFNRIQRAFYREHFKYVASDQGDSELYDFVQDPGEDTNLCAGNPSSCSDMRDKMKMLTKQFTARRRKDVPLSGTAIEQLKALGYVK